MIALIDYELGNLFSLKSSLEHVGIEATLTDDKQKIKDAKAIILPGVGAFRDAIDKLQSTGLDKVIIEEAKKGKPLIGICLGMQLLFDKSYEYGEYQGLGLIDGEIHSMKEDIKSDLKIPHMGWNNLKFDKEDLICNYIKEDSYVYYVHSYYAKNCDESIVAYSNYDIKVPGIVRKDNVYGIQFHPEKSSNVGLNILKAYKEIISK